jgi:N-acetylmuramoyl-L-alanine amidase
MNKNKNKNNRSSRVKFLRNFVSRDVSFYSSLILFFLCAFSTTTAHTKFSIMLDPAGDAQHTGRKLDDNFERGVTLQCADALKKVLESRYPTVRIVLTRFPGETVSYLQNANFANRLSVDLYININFYQEHAVKPQLYIYCFSYGDEFLQKQADLCFCPFDRAYLSNHVITTAWANKIKHAFESGPYNTQFDIKGVFKVPFKPLLGLKAPAIAIEAGLKNKDDWQLYVLAVADSLAPIIELHGV